MLNPSLWFGFLLRNLRLLGALSVLVSAVTWGIDLAGLVHKCPYCQVQRSAIGLAGLLLMLPNPRHWIGQLSVAAISFFGSHVASAQMFLVYRNVTTGKASNPMNFVLALAALIILVTLTRLVFTNAPSDADKE